MLHTENVVNKSPEKYSVPSLAHPHQMKLPFREAERVENSPKWSGVAVCREEKDLGRTDSHTGWVQKRALTQDLMEAVASLKNLTAAAKQVISNGGSCGVDGMTTEELKGWTPLNYESLRQSLLRGDYRVSVVRGVAIPKASGGERMLGIPTVIDRLVQQAIHQVLNPIYDTTFSDNSYGFRPKRGAHRALHQAAANVEVGCRWIVDIDLAKFFDEVNHDRLLGKLSHRIGDVRVIKLIGRFMRSGILRSGLVSQRHKGTPQGSPLSPLLSNIVLDELDQELTRRGHRFVRYADDMIIQVGSQQSAHRVMRSITTFIEGRMKLRVNQSKSAVRRVQETNFLGYRLLNGGHLGISQESERRFKAKVRELTSRRRGISLERMMSELNAALRGWLGYFKHARIKSRLRDWMGWIKRRLRCFRLKQCKRAIGIARFLRKFGLPEERVWLLAGSSRGWYTKACSPPAHESMNNEWFRHIGLYDMLANYG